MLLIPAKTYLVRYLIISRDCPFKLTHVHVVFPGLFVEHVEHDLAGVLGLNTNPLESDGTYLTLKMQDKERVE